MGGKDGGHGTDGIAGMCQFVGQQSAFQQACNDMRSLEASGKATQIARATAPDGKARKTARHIRHALQFRAHGFTERLLAQEPGNGIEPQRDFLRIGQRRGQAFGKESRTAARHRAINRLQQTAVSIARHGAGKFQTGACGRVDKKRAALMFAFGSHQGWALGNLRLLDIGDCTGNS